MDKMNLPMSRTHTIMGKWGYTGSACIPMVLDDAVRAGKLERGASRRDVRFRRRLEHGVRRVPDVTYPIE